MGFINKNIKIASIEASNGRYKIKDSDGVTYSFFEKKQDGSNTQAYDHFMMNNYNNKFTVGSNAKISYTEKPGQTKTGESTIYKNITSFFQTDQEPEKVAPRPSAPVSEAPSSEAITDNRESSKAFGKRLAIHGMVNGRLASGISPQGVKEELKDLFELEDDIETALTDGVQDYNVSDIPF